MTVEEGITYAKARQTRRRNQVTHKEAEEEVPDMDRPVQAAVGAQLYQQLYQQHKSAHHLNVAFAA